MGPDGLPKQRELPENLCPDPALITFFLIIVESNGKNPFRSGGERDRHAPLACSSD